MSTYENNHSELLKLHNKIIENLDLIKQRSSKSTQVVGVIVDEFLKEAKYVGKDVLLDVDGKPSYVRTVQAVRVAGDYGLKESKNLVDTMINDCIDVISQFKKEDVQEEPTEEVNTLAEKLFVAYMSQGLYVKDAAVAAKRDAKTFYTTN